MFNKLLHTYVIALLLLCCQTLYAQKAVTLTVMPTAGKAVGVVRCQSSGRWFVLGSDNKPADAQSFKLSPDAGGGSIIFWEGAPGSKYTILFVPDDVTEALTGTSVTLGGTAPSDPTVTVPGQATRAVYIYEKDSGAVPPQVSGALNKLNKLALEDGTGFVADEYEEDTKSGNTPVPAQYKTARAAALEAGLPCLVVLSGQDVLKVVKNPKSESDILEAIR